MEKENTIHPAFQKNYYLFRKKLFKLFGEAFHTYDENGRVLFYSKQKAFKLKEDFRIYSDETQNQELLAIKTPQILDIGATYYVHDSMADEPVGALRRQALKSIFKDEWTLLSKDGQIIAKITEIHAFAALASRLIKLIPQRYIIVTPEETTIAEIKQHFNPFVLKYSMTISEPEPLIDRRLLVAAGILLSGIEGREE